MDIRPLKSPQSKQVRLALYSNYEWGCKIVLTSVYGNNAEAGIKESLLLVDHDAGLFATAVRKEEDTL